MPLSVLTLNLNKLDLLFILILILNKIKKDFSLIVKNNSLVNFILKPYLCTQKHFILNENDY